MDWGQGVSQRIEMMRSSGGLYREIGPLLAILELQRERQGRSRGIHSTDSTRYTVKNYVLQIQTSKDHASVLFSIIIKVE